MDEVQDLAGYDLDVMEALARSPVRLLMVGDPRQVTYLTHNERRLARYANGGIADYLRMLPKKLNCEGDDASLNRSHRNSAGISPIPRVCYHSGPRVRLVPSFSSGQRRRLHLEDLGLRPLHLATVRPVQLRDKITSIGVAPSSPAYASDEGRLAR